MNYGLIGASGKMGQEIIKYFSEQGHTAVFTLDLDGMRQDGIPEILLDFSQPQVFDTVLYYMSKNLIAHWSPEPQDSLRNRLIS
jgi:4-hydroxy-tetrahydrodipicolinate reductase